MKPAVILVLSALLSLSSHLAADATPQGAAIEHVKKEPDFAVFAEQVIEATQSGDADSLQKLTVIGDGGSFWEATKMGLQMMKHMKVKSSTYDFDASKRFYEKKGAKWDLSLPADGELTITFKIEPQEGDLGDETAVRYMVAKTPDGWRIALPTKKQ